MTVEKFNEKQIEALITKLNVKNDGWSLDNGKLYKQYIFDDFYSAFGFMTQCAMYAQKINHHPEWCNVYNKVKVHLTTHDVSGISVKDADLAKQMDMFALRFV